MLKLENIDVRYGPIHAVKNVSLTVEEGQIVAVVGANGAGKSSLLRAVAGIERINSGSITFDGVRVNDMSTPSRVMRGITLVPEGRQIFVSMTVEENLLMGAYTKEQSVIRKGIEAIFDRFPNLANRRHKLASVLSGGEQQMLAIGRAMIAQPRLMMLDEPSLGLSPILVNQLFELIRELNASGISILLVEQNIKMALDAAERGYVLELGCVRHEGNAAELATDQNLAQAYLG
jgi:branched-chain amino acid transport system ATP-binding protein